MGISDKPTALVAGNWKMNGLSGSVSEVEQLLKSLGGNAPAGVEVMICPPATLIPVFAARAAGTPVRIGGQDCHKAPSGAHTGDISAEMLADAGADAVIVGHSERRADHGETDAMVREKAEAAYRAGLTAIICVGETEAERDGGRTLDVISGQIAGSVPNTATAATTVIAYEPVWAIGTGRTPTGDQIAEVHGHIRQCLAAGMGGQADNVRILYGGSVKPGNAAEIAAVTNVNGALVGGASLKAADFYPIVAAYAR